MNETGRTQAGSLGRYAAANENLVPVVGPHNGLGRAKRAKKTLGRI